MTPPRYSPRSAKALGRLKTAYNDVEIYVEDTACHNMHLLIYRKILGSSVRLTSVNQIGPKAAVLSACELDQADDGRRRLYIVDGDYEIQKGIPRRRLKHHYRLNAYCIENLLFSRRSTSEMGMRCCPNDPEDVFDRNFAYDTWLESVVGILWPLFIIYGVTHSLMPQIETVGFSVYALTVSTSKGPMPDAKKVRQRIYSLARTVRKAVGNSVFSAELQKQRRLAVRKNLHPDLLISGKDYLIPLLHARYSKVCGWRVDREELKVHLASAYDVKREASLARALRASAK